VAKRLLLVHLLLIQSPYQLLVHILTLLIIGLSAIQQQHKNAANTFEDIRTLLLNPDIDTVNVPHLDKEITVQELGSHFFRNIHNQVKQQVGKAVRECVISVPRLISKNINTINN
jgi:molecular chaperone DnaK (HSP70)